MRQSGAVRLWLLPRLGPALTSTTTAVIAFLIAGLVIVATTGHAPWGVYRAVFDGAGLNWLFPWVSGDERANAAFNLQQTLIVATPLMLTGLAVAFAFRCGMFNIGGQGQYLVGQMAAVVVGSTWAGLVRPAHILLTVAVAALAGGVWAAVAGILRATVGAHEVITTIMLNWIAVWVGNYLCGVGGPLQASGQSNPISQSVTDSAKLPVWWGDPLFQGLHIGVFVALGALVLYWIVLNRTTLGFEVRAVGLNAEAARYGGIAVGRSIVVAMALSGMFAGTAGAMDVLGWKFHLSVPDINASTIGFIGIAVALLGRNSALGVLASSLLFAALYVGTSTRQLDPEIFDPELAGNLTLIIQGLIVLFVGADVIVLAAWRRLRRRRAVAGLAVTPPVSVRAHPAVRYATAPKRIAMGGIVLGVVAAWLALPPVHARGVVWPVLVGAAAVVCGGYAVARGVRKPGWGAVAAGLAGVALGILATRSSVAHLDAVFVWGALLASTLRFATPLTFAAIGGLFAERSGVVNIALEGMMLAGAFFGIWGADVTGSWELGLVIAMAAGGGLALIHAIFSVHLRTDQVVGGTAINFLALGITGYLFVKLYGDEGTPTGVAQIPDVRIDWLDSIPPKTVGGFLDASIGQLNLMIWLSLALLVVTYLLVFRTPLGLRLRAVGEHPRAAEGVGISVYAVRYVAVVLSGVLASLGGAYLSIGFVHTFNQNMTEGQGFIGLAALIFGKWRPFGAFGAAMLFGFSSALAFQLPAYTESGAVLFQALPYVLTLVAVAGVIGRSIPPAAVGQPYQKR